MADMVTDFEMYLLASGITDVTRKRALLLYQSGPRVQEIFNQLPPLVTEENEEPGDEYETAKSRLTAYFEPQKKGVMKFIDSARLLKLHQKLLISTTRDYVLWLKRVNFKT